MQAIDVETRCLALAAQVSRELAVVFDEAASGRRPLDGLASVVRAYTRRLEQSAELSSARASYPSPIVGTLHHT